jgi:hypothetical protein
MNGTVYLFACPALAADIIRTLDVFSSGFLEFWVRTMEAGYLNVDEVDPGQRR